MDDSPARLAVAARQLLDADTLLGADMMMPKGRSLPHAAAAPASPMQNAGAPSPAARATTPPRPTAARQPAAPVSPPPPLPPAPEHNLSRQEKAAALEKLDAEHVKKCRGCALAAQRTNSVFGEGNPDAQLVFVGEAPGFDEDQAGRPFVGKAGQLLDKMIAGMGLSRQDVFIANVLKCRPPENRTPQPGETVACSPYLLRQLEIIAPKVIVTLGNPATQTLLRTTEGITRLRGNWQKLPAHTPALAGIPVMPTFHPAYILRCYTVEIRGQVWSDLQKVMELLGLKRPAGNAP